MCRGLELGAALSIWEKLDHDSVNCVGGLWVSSWRLLAKILKLWKNANQTYSMWRLHRKIACALTSGVTNQRGHGIWAAARGDSSGTCQTKTVVHLNVLKVATRLQAAILADKFCQTPKVRMHFPPCVSWTACLSLNRDKTQIPSSTHLQWLQSSYWH